MGESGMFVDGPGVAFRRIIDVRCASVISFSKHIIDDVCIDVLMGGVLPNPPLSLSISPISCNSFMNGGRSILTFNPRTLVEPLDVALHTRPCICRLGLLAFAALCSALHARAGANRSDHAISVFGKMCHVEHGGDNDRLY